MSEGRSSPATLQEQRRPTRNHVNLLHEIVLRAQQDPLATESPKDALLNAYSATFEEHHLDVLQDSVCFWTLLKVIDPGIPPGSLYEKFENVLKDEGIELSFDDDVSQNGTAISTIASISPVRINVRNRRPDNYPVLSNVTSPSDASVGRNRAYNGGHSLAYILTAQGLRPMHQATVPQAQEESLNHDEYMDNPPPHITNLMKIAEGMDRKTLIRQSLAVLQPRGVAAMEYAADGIYTGKLKDKVIHQWRSVALEHQRDFAVANSLYAKKLKRRFLGRIIDAARIQHIKAMDEERLKGMALYKMTLATREAQFRRKVDLRLKTRYLAKLVSALRRSRAHQKDLDAIIQSRQKLSDLRVLRPAIEAMAQAVRKIEAIGAVATAHHDVRAKNSALTKWYDRTRHIDQMQTAADDARQKFLMQKYFRKLQALAHAKRDRRTMLAKWVLSRWRSFVSVQKHNAYDVGYRQMRKVVKMNLARTLLQKWATQMQRTRELEQKADQMYADKIQRIAHRSIVSMYENSQQILVLEQTALANADKLAMKHAVDAMSDRKDRVSQMNEVADRMQTLHGQQIAVKCLRHMSMKGFEATRRERDAEAFRSRHDKRLVRNTWDKIRVLAAQSRGEEPLNLPPATPAQRRAEEINRLTSTTPLYTPASRLSFAARLREEGVMRRDEIASKITEEGDTSLMEE